MSRRSRRAPSCPPTRPRRRRSRACRTPIPLRSAARANRWAGSARSSTAPAATATGRCPTTASARRPTHARSCCACTRSRRTGRPRGAGPGRSRSRTRSRSATRTSRVAWDIVNERTRERLLTGGDFDIESVRQDRRGDLWFGEEFGPYLLHTDRHGRLQGGADPVARRALAGRRRHGDREPRALERLRGHGALRATAARSTRCSKARSPATIRSCAASTRSTSTASATAAAGANTASRARTCWSRTSRCATTSASSRSNATTPKAWRLGTSRRSRSRCTPHGTAAEAAHRRPARSPRPGRHLAAGAPGRHRPG